MLSSFLSFHFILLHDIGDARLVIAAMHRHISSLHIPLCDQLSPLRGVLTSLLQRMKPSRSSSRHGHVGQQTKKGKRVTITTPTPTDSQLLKRVPRARSLISQPEVDYCVQVLYL
jgi:hypothetical protein